MPELFIHVNPEPSQAAEARSLIIEDEGISYAARGLLLAILSRAPEWDMNAERLAVATRRERGRRGEGKAVTRGLFRELEQARYLVRTIGGSVGRLVGTRVDVYDTRRDGSPLAPTKPPCVKDPAARRGSVVYVIGESGSHVVKIGTTCHLRKRLIGLQGSCPVPLDVLWSAHGDSLTESLLHKRLDQYRIHGEWFDFERRDPLRYVQREYDAISNERHAEVERQLAEHGAVVDLTNL